ncbi:hypothetical protein ABZP36_035413 [Zizania latifolia]
MEQARTYQGPHLTKVCWTKLPPTVLPAWCQALQIWTSKHTRHSPPALLLLVRPDCRPAPRRAAPATTIPGEPASPDISSAPAKLLPTSPNPSTLGSPSNPEARGDSAVGSLRRRVFLRLSQRPGRPAALPPGDPRCIPSSRRPRRLSCFAGAVRNALLSRSEVSRALIIWNSL